MKHHLSQFDELAEGCGRSNTPRKEATYITVKKQMKPSKGQLHIGARIRKRCMLKARKVITPGKGTIRQPLTSAPTSNATPSRCLQ